MEDKLGLEVVTKLERLASLRSSWLQPWQDCADFVLPRRSTRFQQNVSVAQPITDRIFDGTAPWANEQLAAGLHSYLTSPTQRWLKFKLADESFAGDDEVVFWLDDCATRLHNLLNNDRTQFVPQVHELYLDIGAIGTGIFYIEELYDPKQPPLRFCTYHLGESYIEENEAGFVDTYYRDFPMTARNALAMFGEKLPEKIRKDALDNPWAEHRFVHCIAPNKDFRSHLPKLGMNMPWLSVYVAKEHKITLRVKGYRRFPILAPRWSKLAGEIYGRSPGMMCMPDIKMVNELSKITLVAAQKVIDPALQLPDEGFLLPIKTSPGGLNFYDASLSPDSRIVPLETKGKIEVGVDLLNMRREHIVRSFYVDWMQIQEGPQMTATEVIQRHEDKMRLMAPMVGRFQSEFLNPLVEYVFETMTERGLLLPPPQHIQGMDLKVEYVSPVARAQRMSQLIGFQRMLENLSNLAAVRPDVLDRVRMDEVPVYYAEMMDAPTRLLLSDKELEAQKEQREQAAEQAQQAQTMEVESKAIKNLAQAQQAVEGTPNLGGKGNLRAVK